MNHRGPTFVDGDAAPLVSIVVICYNDASRLPNAVRSALRQTLPDLEVIIVDDHSDDATQEVSATLAAEDHRVRFHRHATNSGGCGLPRNTGISLARGKYLMFLDSDDELTPNAAEVLVTEADTSGSEIVAGAMERRHLATGQVEPWYHWLYNETYRFDKLADHPEFVHDTVATNKLYRSSFFERTGISFPVGMLYEDVVFTSMAWTRARGISVVPTVVYHWFVYPHEERSTITNQRTQQRNFLDRVTAVLRVREEYSEQPEPVRVEADLKALSHHLMLYLDDLGMMSEDTSQLFLDAARPVVGRIEPRAINRLTATERVVFGLVYAGDTENLRRVLAAKAVALLPGRTVQTEGGEFRWELPWPRSPHQQPVRREQPTVDEARFWLVSDLITAPSRPLDMVPHATVTEAEQHNQTVRLRGMLARTHEQECTPRSVFLTQRGASSTGNEGVVVRIASETPFGWCWETELPEVPRTPETRLPGATLQLQFRDGVALREECEVHALPGVRFTAPIRSALSRLLGDRWIADQHEAGPLHLGIRPGFLGQMLRRLLRLFRAA